MNQPQPSCRRTAAVGSTRSRRSSSPFISTPHNRESDQEDGANRHLDHNKIFDGDSEQANGLSSDGLNSGPEQDNNADNDKAQDPSLALSQQDVGLPSLMMDLRNQTLSLISDDINTEANRDDDDRSVQSDLFSHPLSALAAVPPDRLTIPASLMSRSQSRSRSTSPSRPRSREWDLPDLVQLAYSERYIPTARQYNHDHDSRGFTNLIVNHYESDTDSDDAGDAYGHVYNNNDDDTTHTMLPNSPADSASPGSDRSGTKHVNSPAAGVVGHHFGSAQSSNSQGEDDYVAFASSDRLSTPSTQTITGPFRTYHPTGTTYSLTRPNVAAVVAGLDGGTESEEDGDVQFCRLPQFVDDYSNDDDEIGDQYEPTHRLDECSKVRYNPLEIAPRSKSVDPPAIPFRSSGRSKSTRSAFFRAFVSTEKADDRAWTPASVPGLRSDRAKPVDSSGSITSHLSLKPESIVCLRSTGRGRRWSGWRVPSKAPLERLVKMPIRQGQFRIRDLDLESFKMTAGWDDRSGRLSTSEKEHYGKQDKEEEDGKGTSSEFDSRRRQDDEEVHEADLFRIKSGKMKKRKMVISRASGTVSEMAIRSPSRAGIRASVRGKGRALAKMIWG